jgi:hypothetical protein
VPETARSSNIVHRQPEIVSYFGLACARGESNVLCNLDITKHVQNSTSYTTHQDENRQTLSSTRKKLEHDKKHMTGSADTVCRDTLQQGSHQSFVISQSLEANPTWHLYRCTTILETHRLINRKSLRTWHRVDTGRVVQLSNHCDKYFWLLQIFCRWGILSSRRSSPLLSAYILFYRQFS